MVVLTAIAVLSLIIALLFVRPIFSHLRRGRVVRATGSAVVSAASGALGAAAILFSLSYLSYQRLTAEQAVALIEFTQDSEDEFTARLMLDGQLDKLLPILKLFQICSDLLG